MNHISRQRADLYASDADFCRIFRQDMQSLYLLSLVLTADAEKAEQCFISGLNDCSEGNRVFKEWAEAWARRVVIKNAIRAIKPTAAPAEHSDRDVTERLEQPIARAQAGLPAELAGLLALPALERFAFVMSFCERYSDHDCALLLGCMRTDLVAARLRALQRIGKPEPVHSTLKSARIPHAISDKLQASSGRTLAPQLAVPA